MAISETSLKDVALMTIEEINEKGGVLGRKLEPVVVDPASDWPLFAQKARDLIQKEKVAVTFGCWTSVSRKSVLPVFEELNGLLFYPVQYEGEESSWNVFYTGAAPNQQAIPAVEYLMSKKGGGAKRWVLLGTDYVYPRTTNKILRYFLHAKGVADDDIMEKYTPFGHSDYQTIVADVKKFATGKRTAVVSTINGDSNVPFYKELGNQGIKATDIPVVAFSVGEEELRGIDTKPLVGQLAAWNYFESMDTPENKAFIDKWMAYVKKNNLPGGDKRVTNDPMEATYIGIHMWAQAVEQAQHDERRRRSPGGRLPALQGAVGLRHPAWTPRTTTCASRSCIGEVKADGQFRVVWKTEGPIRAQAWSPFIPDSAKKVADWTYPWACGNCTAPKFGAAGGRWRAQVDRTESTDRREAAARTDERIWRRSWVPPPSSSAPRAHAGPLEDAVAGLAAPSEDDKIEASIRSWPRWTIRARSPALDALCDDRLRVGADGQPYIWDSKTRDVRHPLTGAVVTPAPRPLKEVEVGNEIRRVALPVLAQLQLGIARGGGAAGGRRGAVEERIGRGGHAAAPRAGAREGRRRARGAGSWPSRASISPAPNRRRASRRWTSSARAATTSFFPSCSA